MTEPAADSGVFQVVMLDVMRPGFERWLHEHHLHLFPMPTAEDEPPTFGVGVGGCCS